jgi:hypothetical protein
MIIRSFSVAFFSLVLLSLAPLSIFAQTTGAQNAESIKVKIQKRVANGKTNVVAERVDGTKLKGKISRADDDTFTIVDPKTKQPTVIAYRDTAKIKGSGWPTSAKIALGVGIASAVTLTVLYIAFQNAIRDN